MSQLCTSLCPSFLFKAIRMSSKFTRIEFGGINAWSEMPSLVEWKHKEFADSVKRFSQKTLFSSMKWIQFQGSLFLGAKGPSLLSPGTICGALCKSWWLWLYSIATCEREDVEAAGIHSRNTWTLGFARTTPGNASALPLQGCRNTDCFFLRAG